jgi:lipopolysaccharide export system protein LptA
MMRRFALAFFLCAGLASAQVADLNQGGPIEVTARDGIEWRQNDQVVIARGAAQAVRGGVTIDADLLLARYRPRLRRAHPAKAPAARAKSGVWKPKVLS